MVKHCIITALIRPQNLPYLHASIIAALLPDTQVDWYIVTEQRFNRNAPLPEITWLTHPQINCILCHGHPKNSPINAALDRIVTGWVSWLDDDNIIYPGFFKTISLADYPALLLLDQQLTPTQAEYNPLIRVAGKCEPGYIDTAQIVVARELVGDLRWDPYHPQPDGHFAQQIALKYPQYLRKVGVIACYYNFLAPK